jgi:hypothetical protein
MNKPITAADMFRKLTADFEKMAKEAAWQRRLMRLNKEHAQATQEFLTEFRADLKAGHYAANPVVRTRRANDDIQGDYEISGSHTNGEHGS